MKKRLLENILKELNKIGATLEGYYMNRKYCYIILFIVIVISIYNVVFQYRNEKEQWIEDYYYIERNEFYEGRYIITIWEQNKVFFALIDINEYYYKDNDNHYDYIGTKLLASVKGNNEIIDIVFLQTLPGDTNYGNDNFKKGEKLIRLKKDETGIITEWKAL